MINITEIVVALIGALTTIITIVFAPKVKIFINNKLNEKQIDMILKFAEYAVKYAEEAFWNQSGKTKRANAINFIANELGKYNIVIDEETINKYLDVAVETFVRNK